MDTCDVLSLVAALVIGGVAGFAYMYVRDRWLPGEVSGVEDEVCWRYFPCVSIRVESCSEYIDLEETEVLEMCKREIALDSFAAKSLGNFLFLITDATLYHSIHRTIVLRLRGAVEGVGPCEFTMNTGLDSRRFTITEDGKGLEGYGALDSGGDFKLFVTSLKSAAEFESLNSLREIEGLVVEATARNERNERI